MSRIGWLAATAALTLALAGCEDKAPKPPTVEPPADTTAPGAPRFTAISAVCPTLPAKLPVVRLQITDVSPKNIGHTTSLFAANEDGTASTGKPLKMIPDVLLQTDGPTRLDLDASEFLKKDGDVLLVEVELADAAAVFSGGPAALTAGNPDGEAMFCIKDKGLAINPKPEDRIVRFYVRYVGAKTPLFGKYNIFLRLKDGPYMTPIVLDPKIRDAG